MNDLPHFARMLELRNRDQIAADTRRQRRAIFAACLFGLAVAVGLIAQVAG